MIATKVEFNNKPITITSSEIGSNGQKGTIIGAWTNNIKVLWDDGQIGIYSILKHNIKEI